MLHRRKGSPYWWVSITLNGRRVRTSSRTANKKQAAEFARRLRDREWARSHIEAHTWQEACIRWLDEHEGKRSADRDRDILSWFLPHLRDQLLHEISRDTLDALRQQKAEETSRATANRYMALIRAILRAAHRDWGWLPEAPAVPTYRLEPEEPAWLNREEFARLLPLLPAHTRQLARFAVATGLRRANVTHLRWSQVDLDRAHLQVAGREAKGKRPIPVPLNADALAVLREQAGRDPVWVFPYKGAPVHQVTTKAWRKAAAAIGRPGFTFHDLRHTWASWHVQAGTPLTALQALGGWQSPAMVSRYAHWDSSSLSQYAEAVSHVPVTMGKRKARRHA